MAERPKSTAELISEFLREAAVLILVFVPIDAILAKKEFELSWKVIAVLIVLAVVTSLGLLFVGIKIEQLRSGEEA